MMDSRSAGSSAAQGGEVLRGIATSDAGLVFAEHHFEHPVTGVFDGPMGTTEFQILRSVRRQLELPLTTIKITHGWGSFSGWDGMPFDTGRVPGALIFDDIEHFKPLGASAAEIDSGLVDVRVGYPDPTNRTIIWREP